MKRFLMLVACGVIALSASIASASTNGGDRILGDLACARLPRPILQKPLLAKVRVNAVIRYLR